MATLSQKYVELFRCLQGLAGEFDRVHAIGHRGRVVGGDELVGPGLLGELLEIFADLAGRADPFDVMAMVIAMSMAWSPVSNVYSASSDESDEVHDRRRAFLRDAVRRALSGPASPRAGT